MKKAFSLVLAVSMLLGLLGVCAYAEGDTPVSANVYVTIADGEGKLALAQKKVTVTDADDDGALTINDALYIAHEDNFEGGAEAGYGSELGDYGLSMTKLWGVVKSSSYGYYVNNTSAWSLEDAVEEGDYINAFVYTSGDWSDVYCYFDKNTASATEGDTLTLTLSTLVWNNTTSAFDTVPVKDAAITVDGEATTNKTDDDGKVTVILDKAGELVISATSETQTLVPPVCKVSVEAKAAPDTDEPESTPADTTADITAGTTANTEPDTDGEDGGKAGIIIACAAIGCVAVAAVAAVIIIKFNKKR